MFISKAASGYLTSAWLLSLSPRSTRACSWSASAEHHGCRGVRLEDEGQEAGRGGHVHLAAVADALFVCVLPARSATTSPEATGGSGLPLCRFVTRRQLLRGMYASIMLMTAISVDRFLAVVYPSQREKCSGGGRWGAPPSSAWPSGPWPSRGWRPCSCRSRPPSMPELNITACHDVLSQELLEDYYSYYFSAFSAVFFFVHDPLHTSCYYVSIIRCTQLFRGCQPEQEVAGFAPVGGCLLHLHPLLLDPQTSFCFSTMRSFPRDSMTEAAYFAYLLCVCVSSISCCIDPLIYYYASSECQRHLSAVLHCKESSDPSSCNSSGQLMPSKMDTCSSNLSSSLYKKLLT